MSVNEGFYDENLIDSESPSGKLKEEKNKARSLSSGMQKLGANMYQKGKKQEGEGKTGGAFLTQSGRMMNRGGKALGAIGKGKEAMDKVKDLPGKVSRMGSGKMLQTAWRITFSIYGFLPGIIYINIHVFGHLIFPKMVCALGDEWTGGMLKKAGTGGKLMNYGLGWGESLLLLFLDIILLIAALFVTLLIIYIINKVTNSAAINKIISKNNKSKLSPHPNP